MDHRRVEALARRWCPERQAYLPGPPEPVRRGVYALVAGLIVLAAVSLTLAVVGFKNP